MSDVENLTVQHTATAPATPRVHGAAIAPGMRLGDFRIERALGAGGMGEVYLATDLRLGRDVAIKLLPAGSASDGAERARLFHEAHVQARIRHANIGHIYAAGEDGGRVYFAMEYVDGETLAARVASGPLPIEEALDVVREAACGLAAALREGFLHRDIKPSNLMRDARGRVKVLDFGLVARVAHDGPVEPVTHGGTPRYMAPEQARRERVDQRADIYALGATLYHLAAGAPPFDGDADQLAVLHATAPRP
jgi:serine/threonine-protein kinase